MKVQHGKRRRCSCSRKCPAALFGGCDGAGVGGDADEGIPNWVPLEVKLTRLHVA